MDSFEKVVKCVICQGEGTAVYLRVGPKATRLQSVECPGGCWKAGSPGAQLIDSLNADAAVER